MEYRKQIYVAGDCMISSLGFSTAENMAAIAAGETGIKEVRDCDIYPVGFPAARICRERWKQEISGTGLESYSLLEQFFIYVIGKVAQETGIDAGSEECGLILATTKGNIDRIDSASAYLWEMARKVGAYFHSKEQPVVVSNACISGVSALVVASRWMECGKYKHVLVAGGDLLTRFVVSGFQSFKSVSARPCRPYDAGRDGLTLGEACGCVALTTDRALVKKEPVVVVKGGAMTNDANHISGPSRTGDGLYLAIRSAMEEAGMDVAAIGFVNAHGTATVYNDEMEAKALNWAGLEQVPLNSLKGYWGHTLGASGIIESIACFEQLRKGVVFGTKGFEVPGVSLPLSLSAQHRTQEIACCVKTASGFGGCNAAVVFGVEGQNQEKQRVRPVKAEITGRCRIAGGKVEVDGETRLEAEGCFGDFVRKAFKSLQEPDMKFYKMDDLCKLGYVTVGWLLKGREVEKEGMGIVLANAASSLDTDRRHEAVIGRLGEEGGSPAVFVYTLPNVVVGEICIRHKIQGENIFFICEKKSMAFLQEYAEMLMSLNKLRTVVYGWCELDGEEYEAEMVLCRATGAVGAE